MFWVDVGGLEMIGAYLCAMFIIFSIITLSLIVNTIMDNRFDLGLFISGICLFIATTYSFGTIIAMALE